MGNIYLQQRYGNLLKILLYEEGWVTGDIIARKLKVTTRTVRNDINSINQLFSSANVLVESSRQKGYKLRCGNRLEFESVFLGRDDVPDSPDGRIRQIGIGLLQIDESNPQLIDDLADAAIVSSTTFETDLKKIKETLESRANPVKLHRKNNRVWISTDEVTRRFLLRELILDRTDENFTFIDNYYKYFGKNNMDVMVHCLENVFEDYDISLTDGDMVNLAVYLSIVITRIRNGHTLSDKETYHADFIENQETLANRISRSIESEFCIDLSYCEKLAIERQLSLTTINIGSESEYGRRSKNNDENSENYTQIVDSLLEDIMNKYLIDLRSDFDLRKSLIAHIKRTVNNRDNLTKTTNPILMLLKNEYPFVFEMSLYVYDRIFELFNVKLTEDELGYISSYLCAAIERLESNFMKKKRVISVISNNDTATNRLLMARVISLYGNHYDINGPFSFYDGGKSAEAESSLIISTGPTVRLRNRSTPAIHISPALNDKDVSNINKMLASIKKKSIAIDLPDDIRAYFNADTFYLHPDVESKSDLIRYISDDLYRKGYVPESFYAKTFERENLHPTILGTNMAMPHPIDAIAFKTVISVAILKVPLLWNYKKIQLVFMLAIRKEDVKYLRSFFDITVNLVDEPLKVANLITSSSFGDFMSLLF